MKAKLITFVRGLSNGTPPRFQSYLKSLTLILTLLLSVNAWGETVTYTIASTTSVSKTSGTEPDGASTLFTQDYTTAGQMTSAKPNMSLTLSGFDGCTITYIQFSAKNSNSKKVSGTVKIGGTQIGSISSISLSTTYATKYIDVTDTKVGAGKDVVITLTASGSSVFCESFTITYTPGAKDPVETLYLWEAGVKSSNLNGDYKVGAKYTLPSTCSQTCGTKTFVGWSTVEIQNPGAKPTSNYYDKGAEVTLTADNTFYAVFADASSGGGSTTKSYGFEDSDDETLWMIDGPAKESGNAHSGSKSGKINTNNTYVQFKDKVKVTSFSYWFKRTSTNSNYNVYIETSTDGTNWEAVDTKAMSSFNNGSYAGSPVEKTFDGTKELYVRFHCYNTTAVRYVDDVSITYSGGTTYSNYTTACGPFTYTLLFSELIFAHF